MAPARIDSIAENSRKNRGPGPAEIGQGPADRLGRLRVVAAHDDGQAGLLRRALILEYVTIAWNSVEFFITVGLGLAAQSLALVAFGLDSLIELFASAVLVWHLRVHHTPGLDARVERALRLVALAFAVLGVYLLASSTRSVIAGDRPESSMLGIAYLGLTAIVMFSLSRLKHATSAQLESEPLRAEASMTTLDSILAFGILCALALNATLDWWWADPLAAGVVGVVALREAREAWEEAQLSKKTPGDDAP